MSRFIIKYDELPLSVNNYLRPSAIVSGGKAIVHMYETRESKDWKKRFQAYLKREVVKQKWDKASTAEGHWYLDCVFYQARTNQDNNNYYKLLCDALSGIIIEDDKNILVRTQRIFYDSKQPKFVAVLRQVEYIGVWKDLESYDRFFADNCMQCKKNHEKCAILKKAKEGRIQPELKQENMFQTCEKKKL
ncbi:RusA family crossover junction endodeoxyribonuclease [Bacillus thuringiensis]|uniref:RusA family crossover junction endodeoxyribonuclease n=1 Tax=Bacillus thuringiensis TaxID=1428 RepID=UPI00211D604D|nr:RusA family crossover junction endodeoxyribonuclease [Bacillus thuringiensis]